MNKQPKAIGGVASPAVPVVLVTVEHGQPVTTTERVAAAAGLKHASVIRMVRDHLTDFEEFGKVRFEIRLNPQGSPTEYAELNEQHAALLFLYQRNTAKVRAFKMRMLKDFARVTAELAKLKSMRAAPNWKPARVAAAAEFTNVIEMLRECREAQGKTTARHHYINEATLMRHAFSGDSKTKWDRDNLSAADLKALSKVERLNLRLLARDVPYADRKAQCRALWLRETGFILEGGAK